MLVASPPPLPISTFSVEKVDSSKKVEYLERNYSIVLIHNNSNSKLEDEIRAKLEVKRIKLTDEWNTTMDAHERAALDYGYIELNTTYKGDILKFQEVSLESQRERYDHRIAGQKAIDNQIEAQIIEELVNAGLIIRSVNGSYSKPQQQISLYDLSTGLITELNLKAMEYSECALLQCNNILFQVHYCESFGGRSYASVYKVWNIITKTIETWFPQQHCEHVERYTAPECNPHPIRGFLIHVVDGVLWVKSKNETILLICDEKKEEDQTVVDEYGDQEEEVGLHVYGQYIVFNWIVYDMNGAKISTIQGGKERKQFELYYGDNTALMYTSDSSVRKYNLTTGTFDVIIEGAIDVVMTSRYEHSDICRSLALTAPKGSITTQLVSRARIEDRVQNLSIFASQMGRRGEITIEQHTLMLQPFHYPTNTKDESEVIFAIKQRMPQFYNYLVFKLQPLRDGRLIVGYHNQLRVFDLHNKTELERYNKTFIHNIRSLCVIENPGEDQRIGRVLREVMGGFPDVLAILIAQFHS